MLAATDKLGRNLSRKDAERVSLSQQHFAQTLNNAGYTTSVTPEDGTDTVPGVRSNVFAPSVVLTRIMDYWGRTGGLSIVLPYALIDTSAGPFNASTNGVSDVGLLFFARPLWQMNIFGGPAAGVYGMARPSFRRRSLAGV